MPVFNAAIDIEHRLIIPRRVACVLCEVVPVVLMSPRPNKTIDAGTAAQNLSHAQREGAPVQMWVGLPYKRPIAFTANIQEPLRGIRDGWHIFASSGLN